MHEWCEVSQFCVRCGIGQDEALDWRADQCYPNPAGVAFTETRKRSLIAFSDMVLDQLGIGN